MVLPIKQEDIYMGLAEINGLIRAGERSLEIEYKIKDDVFGIFDSSVKKCKIPFRFIESIEVEQKWFSGRFNIYLNRLPDLDSAFKIKENCLPFKFKKTELEKARTLRSRLMLDISEQKLKDLDDETMGDFYADREDTFKTTAFQDQEPVKKQKQQTDGRGLKNMLRDNDSE